MEVQNEVEVTKVKFNNPTKRIVLTISLMLLIKIYSIFVCETNIY